MRTSTGPDSTAIAVAGGAGPVRDVVTAPVFAPAQEPVVAAGRTTGRLFFTVGGRPRSCTAAVVASGSGSVVATAGHCLLTTHVATGWEAGADWAQDVGFLRLARSSDGAIQTLVGAQGLVFGDPAPAPAAAVLGYPAVAPFDGAALRWCLTSRPASPDLLDPAALGVPCAMTPGYSGGPLLAQFDRTSGAGYLVAVASRDYSTGTLYGAGLGAAALGAYREADR